MRTCRRREHTSIAHCLHLVPMAPCVLHRTAALHRGAVPQLVQPLQLER